jgi:hypothetical protein
MSQLCEGTTPQGREVFRKLLEWSFRLSLANPNTTEVIAQVEARLGTFSELQQELSLLFGRICGQQQPPGEMTVHDLAALMVLRSRVSRQFKQEELRL